jgi:tetratricopeptide (TPR) repeat protein
MRLQNLLNIVLRKTGGLWFTSFFIVFNLFVNAKEANSHDSLEYFLSTSSGLEKKVDLIIDFLDKPENQYLENAPDYALRAYKISQQAEYAVGKINAMIKLGYYSFRSSDYKSAMEYAQNAREMAEDLNLQKELAFALRLIGTIYNEFGDYNNSSGYFFKSLRIFEKIGSKEGISQALGDIGMDFYYQQDYTKALDYYYRALKLANELNNPSLIKRQYNNISNVHGDLMEADSAIYYLDKAIIINQKLKDHLGEGTNIMNIGFNLLNKGEYNTALQSFGKAMDIFVKLNNKTRMAECSLNMGYCYQVLNKVDECIKSFSQALAIAKELSYFRIIYMASQELDKIYTTTIKDTIKAYKYILLEKLANDSLYASQNQKQLIKLELQYTYDKKELLRKQAQQKKNTLMLILILSLLSGIVILGLALSRFRLKSKFVFLEKERIKAELNIKKRELSVNLISLIRKNEMLSEVSDELINLEKQAKGIEAKEILELISRKLRNGTDDKMLEEFTVQFQEVHAGFYESLLKLFPDLTQNELKLCAFLRLNMSTKDISELTGQQLASIDKARYRLRRKLGISNSDKNLVSFLSQI